MCFVENFLDDLSKYISQPAVAAVMWEGPSFMIEAQQVRHRSVQIVQTDPVTPPPPTPRPITVPRGDDANQPGN